MSTLFFENQLHPFDILFRNLYESDGQFAPASKANVNHPLDLYENEKGLHFEIACTGLDSKDVTLSIEGDILKISYNKLDSKGCENGDCNYIHKGIAKRSFNLAYKIASKYDLSKSEAEMKNGLLKISIPFAEASKPKLLNIK